MANKTNWTIINSSNMWGFTGSKVMVFHSYSHKIMKFDLFYT